MLTGIEDHITIIDGKMPSEKTVDGIVEVLVTEQALVKRSMVLGSVFIVGSDEEHQFLVKPVGTFQQKVGESPYWSLNSSSFSEDFIVHEEWFRSELLTNHEDILGIGRFSAAFDYHQITDSHFPSLLTLESKRKSQITKVKKATILFNFPIKSILKSYENKGETINDDALVA